MKRSRKAVQLHGAWSRRYTTFDDIAFIRAYLNRRLNEVGVRCSFRVSRVAGDQHTPQLRTGTFNAFFEDVPHLIVHQAADADAEVAKRALMLLRSYLREYTCRPPKLTLKSARVIQVWEEVE